MTGAVQAITANRLDSGEVVFRAAGAWTPILVEAERYDDPALADAELARARGEVRVVIDPYLIALRVEAGLPIPQSYRERVRALGPSDHPDLGKQAQGGAAVEAVRAAEGAARSSGRLGLIRRK